MFRVPTLEQKDLTSHQTLEMSTALDKVTLRNQKPEARNNQGGKAGVEMHKFKVTAYIGAMGQRFVFIWCQQFATWLSQSPLKVQEWVEDLCYVWTVSCDNKIIKIKNIITPY